MHTLWHGRQLTLTHDWKVPVATPTAAEYSTVVYTRGAVPGEAWQTVVVLPAGRAAAGAPAHWVPRNARALAVVTPLAAVVAARRAETLLLPAGRQTPTCTRSDMIR